MPVPTASYQIHAKGFWSPVIHISGPDGDVGVLKVSRNRWGMVVSAAYTPEKGEKLEIRRDPGILRSQFSLWSEGREWLGASLRWSFIGREGHSSRSLLDVAPQPTSRRVATASTPCR